jgi:hypothetical protein
MERVVGFYKDVVKPGETVELRSNLRLTFDPKRLVLPAHIAESFRVLDLLSDGVSANAVPLVGVAGGEFKHGVDYSTRNSWPSRVCELPACKSGRDMTLILRNTSGRAWTHVGAAVVGLAAE